MHSSNTKICILLLLLGLLTHKGYSQDMPLLHFTEENGLPSNRVSHIYRDSKAFLWIATNQGLARYNGKDFELFTTADGLPENEIKFFQEDLTGKLWMCTNSGALCFYENGTFFTNANNPLLDIPSKLKLCSSIVAEKDSSVTINYNESNSAVNISDKKQKILNWDKMSLQEEDKEIIFTTKLTKNRYLIATTKGIQIVDTMSQSTFKNLYQNQYANSKDNYKELVFSQNNKYIIDYRGIYTTKLEFLHAFPQDFRKNMHINSVYSIDNTNFMVLTNNGVYINDSIHILKGINVTSATQDLNGNYWITTLGKGIYCLKDNYKEVSVYKNGYSSSIHFCTIKKGQLFYATTDNNLFVLQQGIPKCLYDNKKNDPEKFPFTFESGLHLNDELRYINIYNEYFIITKPLLHNNVFATVCKNFPTLAGIEEVIEGNGYLYAKSQKSIYCLPLKEITNSQEKIWQKLYTAGNQDAITAIEKDENGQIWVASADKVFKIQDQQLVEQSTLGNYSIKYFNIIDSLLVGVTTKNKLIICSIKNGAYLIDTLINQPCVWEKFYRVDNLHMLLTTNNLHRLLTIVPNNARKKYILTIIEDPFIPLRPEAVCANAGNCYFFKDGKITRLGLSALQLKPLAPELYFTQLKYGKNSIHINNSISVSYAESRNIAISFAYILTGGKEIITQYSISKNKHNHWRYINANEITLANTSYGKYYIKLRAKTNASAFSMPILFELEIGRPYWATWWFITSCSIVSISIVVLLLHYRTQKALRKKEKEHDTEIKFMKSEYKALNALMNPHFIFNTLNNVQGLVNRNDKRAANEYLRVFADLIRQNMHNVTKELIPLSKEMNLVTNYLLLEKLRFKDLLNYEITIGEGLDLSEITVPPLLVQPLVENSIKHGILPSQSGEGFIYISIYEINNLIYIEVKDNGIGIQAAQGNKPDSHESFGLSSIIKRIDHLSKIQNKKIGFQLNEEEDDNGQVWTKVTITIPA